MNDDPPVFDPPVIDPLVFDAPALLDAFRRRTLPKPAWTHEAHVAVCWATLAEMDEGAALDRLRRDIRTYNESVGTANTDDGGYHETITRYFVHVVASRAGRPLDEVLADPACSRGAPLEHWSRDVLFSVAARRGWVEPDLIPLDQGADRGAR